MNTLTTVGGNDPYTATTVPLPPVDGPELGHLPTDTMQWSPERQMRISGDSRASLSP